jgi:hypothetical protein
MPSSDRAWSEGLEPWTRVVISGLVDAGRDFKAHIIDVGPHEVLIEVSEELPLGKIGDKYVTIGHDVPGLTWHSVH